jgi:hypothetical protein
VAHSLNHLWQRGRELLGCEHAIMGGAMSWVSERNLVAAIFGDDLDDQTTLITPAAISACSAERVSAAVRTGPVSGFMALA